MKSLRLRAHERAYGGQLSLSWSLGLYAERAANRRAALRPSGSRWFSVMDSCKLQSGTQCPDAAHFRSDTSAGSPPRPLEHPTSEKPPRPVRHRRAFVATVVMVANMPLAVARSPPPLSRHAHVTGSKMWQPPRRQTKHRTHRTRRPEATPTALSADRRATRPDAPRPPRHGATSKLPSIAPVNARARGMRCPPPYPYAGEDGRQNVRAQTRPSDKRITPTQPNAR